MVGEAAVVVGVDEAVVDVDVLMPLLGGAVLEGVGLGEVARERGVGGVELGDGGADADGVGVAVVGGSGDIVEEAPEAGEGVLLLEDGEGVAGGGVVVEVEEEGAEGSVGGDGELAGGDGDVADDDFGAAGEAGFELGDVHLKGAGGPAVEQVAGVGGEGKAGAGVEAEEVDLDVELGLDLVAVLAEEQQAVAAGDAELDGSEGGVAEGFGFARGVVEAEGEGGALEGGGLQAGGEGAYGIAREELADKPRAERDRAAAESDCSVDDAHADKYT